MSMVLFSASFTNWPLLPSALYSFPFKIVLQDTVYFTLSHQFQTHLPETQSFSFPRLSGTLHQKLEINCVIFYISSVLSDGNSYLVDHKTKQIKPFILHPEKSPPTGHKHPIKVGSTQAFFSFLSTLHIHPNHKILSTGLNISSQLGSQFGNNLCHKIVPHQVKYRMIQISM